MESQTLTPTFETGDLAKVAETIVTDKKTFEKGETVFVVNSDKNLTTIGVKEGDFEVATRKLREFNPRMIF